MSTSPVDQMQPPPPPPFMQVPQQDYTAHPGHTSVGPVIAVLAVITILGVMAGMVGRLCSGRPIFGRGHFDFEGWVERKCSSCIDGRVDPPPTRPPPERVEEGTHEEVKPEEQEPEEEPEQEQEQEQERKPEHDIGQKHVRDRNVHHASTSQS